MDKDKLIVFVSVITIFIFIVSGYTLTHTVYNGMTDNMFQYGYDDGYYEHNHSNYLKYENYTHSAWGTDNFSLAYIDYADGYVKGYNKWNKTNN